MIVICFGVGERGFLFAMIVFIYSQSRDMVDVLGIEIEKRYEDQTDCCVGFRKMLWVLFLRKYGRRAIEFRKFDVRKLLGVDVRGRLGQEFWRLFGRRFRVLFDYGFLVFSSVSAVQLYCYLGYQNFSKGISIFFRSIEGGLKRCFYWRLVFYFFNVVIFTKKFSFLTVFISLDYYFLVLF